MEEKLVQIIEHYGIREQLKYIHSEYFELDEAIIDYLDSHSKSIKEVRLNRGHIAEEIADIMVMLKQFQYIFLISDEVVKDIMSYKIDRQLERIKDGKDK